MCITSNDVVLVGSLMKKWNAEMQAATGYQVSLDDSCVWEQVQKTLEQLQKARQISEELETNKAIDVFNAWCVWINIG